MYHYVCFRAGGLLYLGQDQDSLGGGFNLRQSWGGEITQFNLWSWALEEYYIENMAECRSDLFGDVLKWDENNFFLGKVEYGLGSVFIGVLNIYKKPSGFL